MNIKFLSPEARVALRDNQLHKIAADMLGVETFDLHTAVQKLASVAYIKRIEDDQINDGLEALETL